LTLYIFYCFQHKLCGITLLDLSDTYICASNELANCKARIEATRDILGLKFSPCHIRCLMLNRRTKRELIIRATGISKPVSCGTTVSANKTVHLYLALGTIFIFHLAIFQMEVPTRQFSSSNFTFHLVLVN